MKAFTLVEVLMVTALLIVLVSVTSFISANLLGRRVALDLITQDVISTLKTARSNTMGSKNFSQYGVHIDTNQYTFFTGSIFSSSSSSNEVHQLPGQVEIATTTISGNTIVFERINGSTQNTGTITLRDKKDASSTRTIIVESSGNTSIQQTTALLDTRVTDTRHVHFDLGWSIQGESTLTLTFNDPPNPDQIEDIVMAGYFNGSTEFDWQDTISVGGENQTLRVHTHNLTASDTLLSIHRDARLNSKAVQVAIDGKDISSYDASNQVTVGLFGGTMEIQ